MPAARRIDPARVQGLGDLLLAVTFLPRYVEFAA